MGSPNPDISTSRNHDIRTRTGVVLVCLSVFLLFVFDPMARDPFLGPRLVTGGVFGLVVHWLIPHLGTRDTPSPWPAARWIVIAFTLWLLAGAIWAPNPRESLFFISRFGLYALVFSALLRLRLPDRWQVLTWLGSSLAVFLGIWTLFQSTGLINFPEGYPQPIGFSGNRNISGNLLALVIPFTLLGYLRKPGISRLWYGFALLAGTTGVVLSQTRSAWLATGLGLLITVILIFRKEPHFTAGERKSWRRGMGTLLLLVATLPVLVWLAAPYQVSKEISGRFKSLVQPLQTDSTYTSFTIDNRIQVWSATTEMIQDYPLTGVGTGNWRFVYPIYQRGDLRRSEYDTDKQVTRPHNLFLRIGAENGVPGFLLLLALIAIPVILGARALRGATRFQEVAMLSTAIAGWLTILVDSLFSFGYERPENMLVALTFAATIWSMATGTAVRTTSLTRGVPVKWVATFLAVFVLIMGIARWRTDRYLTRIIDADFANQPYAELELVAKAKNPFIKNGPVGDPLELFAARAYLTLDQPERAVDAARQALRWHPNSFRIYNTLGLAQLRNGEQPLALQSLKKAEQLAPGYEPIRVNLALTHYALGNNQQLDSVLSLLDLQKYPALEGMPYSLIVRQKQEALDANPMASAIRFIIQQFDEQQNDIDVAPLVERRQMAGSNEQFITDYVDALYQINALYFYTRKNPERADSIYPAYQRAKQLLLNAKDNPYILSIIYENDHAATQRVLAVADSASLQTVRDFMFWVNAPN